jgi:hypothetical protein
MTGNTFAPDAVARIAELIRSGIDPRAVRRQAHREFPALTTLGLDRAFDLACEELHERSGRAA